MKLEQSFEVAAPIERVWTELADPKRKVMSNDLRSYIQDCLNYAEGEGVRFDG